MPRQSGHFRLGPQDGAGGDVGDFGPPARPTAALLADVERTGFPATVTEFDRRQAKRDLDYWNAGVIVLDVRHPKAGPLRQTLDDLLGPGTESNGVWLWEL